jgi:hypothetical protein
MLAPISPMSTPAPRRATVLSFCSAKSWCVASSMAACLGLGLGLGLAHPALALTLAIACCSAAVKLCGGSPPEEGTVGHPTLIRQSRSFGISLGSTLRLSTAERRAARGTATAAWCAELADLVRVRVRVGVRVRVRARVRGGLGLGSGLGVG